MTIVDSIVDTIGGRTEAQLAMRFAELLNLEARALADAGAAVIQFDEPCFNVYVDKVKDWGMAALECAAQGVTATKAVHICYGYGTAGCEALEVRQPRLEPLREPRCHCWRNRRSIRCRSKPPRAASMSRCHRVACVARTCCSASSMSATRSVETPELVAQRLHAALRYTDPGHLYACTDCGMLPLSRKAAEGKLRALAGRRGIGERDHMR